MPSSQTSCCRSVGRIVVHSRDSRPGQRGQGFTLVCRLLQPSPYRGIPPRYAPQFVLGVSANSVILRVLLLCSKIHAEGSGFPGRLEPEEKHAHSNRTTGRTLP